MSKGNGVKGRVSYSNIWEALDRDDLVIIPPIKRGQQRLLLELLKPAYWSTRWIFPDGTPDIIHTDLVGFLDDISGRLGDFMYWNDVEQLITELVTQGTRVADAVENLNPSQEGGMGEIIAGILFELGAQGAQTILLNNQVQHQEAIANAIPSLGFTDQQELSLISTIDQIKTSLQSIATSTDDISTDTDSLSHLTQLDSLACMSKALCDTVEKSSDDGETPYLPIIFKGYNSDLDAHRCRQAKRAIGLLVELFQNIKNIYDVFYNGRVGYFSIRTFLSPLVKIARASIEALHQVFIDDPLFPETIRPKVDVDNFIVKLNDNAGKISGALYKSGNVDDFISNLDTLLVTSGFSVWERNAIKKHTSIYNKFHQGLLADDVYKSELSRLTDPAELINFDCTAYAPSLAVYDHSAYPEFLLVCGEPPQYWLTFPIDGNYTSTWTSPQSHDHITIECEYRYIIDVEIISAVSDVQIEVRDYHVGFLGSHNIGGVGSVGQYIGSRFHFSSPNPSPFEININFTLLPSTQEL